MAPHDPTDTARLFIDYNDAVHDHVLEWRFNETFSSLAAAQDFADQFLTALASNWYHITILGAREAFAGAHISHPVTWSGAASYGTGTMPAVNAPRQVRWELRSSLGTPGSLSLFGVNEVTPATYRLDAGSFGYISDSIDVLRAASAADALVCADNKQPFIKSYANFNFNSYWERKAR